MTQIPLAARICADYFKSTLRSTKAFFKKTN